MLDEGGIWSVILRFQSVGGTGMVGDECGHFTTDLGDRVEQILGGGCRYSSQDSNVTRRQQFRMLRWQE